MSKTKPEVTVPTDQLPSCALSVDEIEVGDGDEAVLVVGLAGVR